MISNRIHLLAPPPRSVPIPVVCNAMLGIAGSIGAIFLIMGLAFTIIFTQGFYPLDNLRLALSHSTARGIVTNIAGTHSSENEMPVYQYTYQFTTGQSTNIIGYSYSTGKKWLLESSVIIQYVDGDPSISKIQGTRTSLFDVWIWFVIIFPTIGATLFVYAAVIGWRQVMLLRYGLVGDAHILSTQPTNVSVNNRPVLEYIYEVQTADGGKYQGSAKSLPTERIGDEVNEPAMYLPDDPDKSTLVDAIPLSHPLTVDEVTGKWTSQNGLAKTILYILVWIMSIGLTIFWVLRMLRAVP